MISTSSVDGQTPPDPDELAGLVPGHITTQSQLNAWEQANIVAGQRWAMRVYRKREMLDESFTRELHKRMFDQTWKWAGTYRRSDKNIGVDWRHVGTRLHQLLANVRHRVEARALPPDEQALRFHRDLVWIHPFPNGNGRHARLMTDLFAMRLGRPRFTWSAAADLASAGSARDAYLFALRAADGGDHAPLLHFARS